MFEDEFLYPQITLENEDIIMDLTVKKDYCDMDNIQDRKKQFIKDLEHFLEEFNQSPDSLEFFKYYDD